MTVQVILQKTNSTSCHVAAIHHIIRMYILRQEGMLRELMRSRVHGESNLRIDRRQSRFRLLGLPTKQRRTST